MLSLYLSVCLSVCLYIYLSIYLSDLSIYLSIYLIYLIYLSIFLSIYLIYLSRPTYSLPLLVFSAYGLSYSSPRLLSFHLCLCSPFLFDRAYICTRCRLPPLSLSLSLMSSLWFFMHVYMCRATYTLPLLMFSECGLPCTLSVCRLCVCSPSNSLFL